MNIEMTVRVWLDRETGQYIASALPIDVASHGPTPQAAQAALEEAVEAFVSTAQSHGTLAEVMEECGYTREGDKWLAPPLVLSQERMLKAGT
jgi:predicted RNase H-like HicB family nuclease